MSKQKYNILYHESERPYEFGIQDVSDFERFTKQEKPDLKEVFGFFKKWKQYPDAWSCYCVALKKNARKTEAENIMNQLLELFPDYFYGKLLLVEYYLEKKDYEKARELLGQKPDISLMQPDRTAFFYEDILKYYATYYALELALDNLEAAEQLLKKAETEVEKENEIVSAMRERLFAYKNTQMLQFEEIEEIETPPTLTNVNDYDNYSPQEFNHEEIADIYFGRFEPNKKEIDKVLALPRETMIADFKEIIRRSFYKNRKTVETDDLNAFAFALFFLTELKAIESLDVILQLMRQNDDYFDHWIGDFFDDLLYPLLYQLSVAYPEEIKAYLKEPNLFTYAKVYVAEAQARVVYFHPEKREFVLEWFKSLLEFYYQEKDNENIEDLTFFGCIEATLLDIKFKELLPMLEKFHEELLIDESICGDFKQVKKAFEEEDNITFENHTIYETFKSYIDDIKKIENRERYEKYISYIQKSTYNEGNTFIKQGPSSRTEKKIGRNEPCPCGSGKKYKKCCGK